MRTVEVEIRVPPQKKLGPFLSRLSKMPTSQGSCPRSKDCPWKIRGVVAEVRSRPQGIVSLDEPDDVIAEIVSVGLELGLPLEGVSPRNIWPSEASPLFFKDETGCQLVAKPELVLVLTIAGSKIVFPLLSNSKDLLLEDDTGAQDVLDLLLETLSNASEVENCAAGKETGPEAIELGFAHDGFRAC